MEKRAFASLYGIEWDEQSSRWIVTEGASRAAAASLEPVRDTPVEVTKSVFAWGAVVMWLCLAFSVSREEAERLRSPAPELAANEIAQPALALASDQATQ